MYTLNIKKVTVGVAVLLLAGLVLSAVAWAALSVSWTRQFNGAFNGNDRFGKVVGSEDGTSFVTGSVQTSADETDIVLRSYSSTGTLGLNQTIDVSTGIDRGNGISLDSTGNIYMTGSTMSSTASASDIWVGKYSAAGVLVWQDVIDGSSTTSNDIGYDIAVNGSTVTVAGTIGDANGRRDGWVRAYDLNGNAAWTRSVTSTAGGNDDAFGVDLASDGHVYVAGKLAKRATGTSSRSFVRRYAPDGTVDWTKRPNDQSANGIALRGSDLFVTGRTRTAATAASSTNMWLRKYNSGGAHVWTRIYDGGGGGNDGGNDVAIDSKGAAYVAGYVEPDGGARRILLRKYKPGGDVAWTLQPRAGTISEGVGVMLNHRHPYVSAFYSHRGSQKENGWLRKYNQ